MTRSTGYSAPALEKGLDVLELLARHGRPLGTAQIAQELGRSRNELFRMIHVLLARGYIVRDPVRDALSLSNRLFTLGIQTARSRDLVSIAAPLTERLAHEIGHAANLVVAHNGETVVIASMSGGADVNFSLRLGYHRPLIDAHSGLVLLAFQPPEHCRAMIAESRALVPDPPDEARVLARIASIRRRGHIAARSRDIAGVTDIAFPILAGNGRAIACMTVTALKRKGAPLRIDELAGRVAEVCRVVTARLAGEGASEAATVAAAPARQRRTVSDR